MQSSGEHEPCWLYALNKSIEMNLIVQHVRGYVKRHRFTRTCVGVLCNVSVVQSNSRENNAYSDHASDMKISSNLPYAYFDSSERDDQNESSPFGIERAKDQAFPKALSSDPEVNSLDTVYQKYRFSTEYFWGWPLNDRSEQVDTHSFRFLKSLRRIELRLLQKCPHSRSLFRTEGKARARFQREKVGLNSNVLNQTDQDASQILSAGERQMLSLARALLSSARVVVCDEPTSNVDMYSDRKIQDILRHHVVSRKCTLITIAHRLQTIVDYDKVLVMDDGTVKEFDSPRVLLRDKNSTLYSMAFRSGGIDMVKNLLSISG